MWYEGLFVLVSVVVICMFVFGVWDDDDNDMGEGR
jgi:hypothetical protein